MNGTTSRRRFLAALASATATTAACGSGADGRSLRSAVQPTSTTVPASTTASRPSTLTSSAAPDDATTPARSSGSTAAGAADLPVLAIPVLCREAWGAAPADGGLVAHTVDRVTIHHSAVGIGDPRQAPDQIATHQRFHQNDRGWPDIAYHYLIDIAGNIYEGRDPAFRGDTATDYDPTGHFLVCLDNNHDDHRPTEVQLDVLTSMLAWASATFAVSLDTLGGHRDFAATTCPGDHLYNLIVDGSLRAGAEAILGRARPELDDVCGQAGYEAVADIESGV